MGAPVPGSKNPRPEGVITDRESCITLFPWFSQAASAFGLPCRSWTSSRSLIPASLDRPCDAQNAANIQNAATRTPVPHRMQQGGLELRYLRSPLHDGRNFIQMR